MGSAGGGGCCDGGGGGDGGGGMSRMTGNGRSGGGERRWWWVGCAVQRSSLPDAGGLTAGCCKRKGTAVSVMVRWGVEGDEGRVRCNRHVD